MLANARPRVEWNAGRKRKRKKRKEKDGRNLCTRATGSNNRDSTVINSSRKTRAFHRAIELENRCRAASVDVFIRGQRAGPMARGDAAAERGRLSLKGRRDWTRWTSEARRLEKRGGVEAGEGWRRGRRRRREQRVGIRSLYADVSTRFLLTYFSSPPLGAGTTHSRGHGGEMVQCTRVPVTHGHARSRTRPICSPYINLLARAHTRVRKRTAKTNFHARGTSACARGRLRVLGFLLYVYIRSSHKIIFPFYLLALIFGEIKNVFFCKFYKNM